MRLDDVLEQLEQWFDDEDSEELIVDENVITVKATKVVIVFISPPDNEVITAKDLYAMKKMYSCIINLAVTANVKAMFYQVQVTPRDQDALTFF